MTHVTCVGVLTLLDYEWRTQNDGKRHTTKRNAALRRAAEQRRSAPALTTSLSLFLVWLSPRRSPLLTCAGASLASGNAALHFAYSEKMCETHAQRQTYTHTHTLTPTNASMAVCVCVRANALCNKVAKREKNQNKIKKTNKYHKLLICA